MKRKKKVYHLLNETDIKQILQGSADAIKKLIEHYERLIDYLLRKEIAKVAYFIGVDRVLFRFDDLKQEVILKFIQRATVFSFV